MSHLLRKAAQGQPCIGMLLMVVPWLAGVVLAKGFWSTLFAITIPPWAWYLLVERVMHMWGMV